MLLRIPSWFLTNFYILFYTWLRTLNLAPFVYPIIHPQPSNSRFSTTSYRFIRAQYCLHVRENWENWDNQDRSGHQKGVVFRIGQYSILKLWSQLEALPDPEGVHYIPVSLTKSAKTASLVSKFVWKWHKTRRNWPNLKKCILFGVNNRYLAVFLFYFEFQAFLIVSLRFYWKNV